MHPRPKNTYISRISLYGESLARLVFPEDCALCSSSLRLAERHLCQSCFLHLERERLAPEQTVWRKRSGPLWEGYSLYAYRGIFRDYITLFKFTRQPWLLKSLRAPLRKFLLALSLETRYDALTPIPMTLSRFMERHYNPAELLAQEITNICKIPVLPLLQKKRSTPAQHDLTGEERRMNLRGCFAIRRGTRTQGLRVLLIDDILTTGSTALEAARVLDNAGVQYSGIMTLARTLERKTLL